MNTKSQGIQEFLTPSKLLMSYKATVKSKPPNSSIQQSPQLKNNPKQKTDFILALQNQSMESSRFKKQINSNRSVQNSNQSYQRLNQSNQYKKNSVEQIHKNSNRDQYYDKYVQRNNSQGFQSHIYKNSLKNKYQQKQHQITHNPQISSLHSKQLVRKLMQIKKGLQYELLQLQNLLDDTNLYLKQIDHQYEKIKKHILKFASDYLDSAFHQYKCNMDWSKYQKIQTKGINLLAQLNQIIFDQENQINQTHQTSNYNGFNLDKKKYSFQHQQRNKKVQAKINNYREIVKDIEQVRKKCIQRRPTISQQRLRKLQIALIQIGKFDKENN